MKNTNHKILLTISKFKVLKEKALKEGNFELAAKYRQKEKGIIHKLFPKPKGIAIDIEALNLK